MLRSNSFRDLSVDMFENEDCFVLMKILVQALPNQLKSCVCTAKFSSCQSFRWLVRTGGSKDKTGFVSRGLEADMMIITISYLPLK